MIENNSMPFVPSKTGEIAMGATQNVADILLPTPVGQIIVVAVLAFISFRLLKGFRKQQKSG